ncbi:hypothetical protein [Sodalis sp.]|uniref:hypothetical protein n=1 Tax=Sodalis sp. (in: enterobacteria) TaxID=1898979 RepID=UPI0038731B72
MWIFRALWQETLREAHERGWRAQNARRAGVSALITLQEGEVAQCVNPMTEGPRETVVSNPLR